MRLSAVAAPDVPNRLIGDSHRLRQILLNLVSNAVKFTKIGGVMVDVRLVDVPEGEDIVLRVEVTDSGIGIPAEVLDRLFSPFTQADASTTRQYGGTGTSPC